MPHALLHAPAGLASFEPSRSSPAVDASFRGIRLAAPASIVLAQDAALPLFGTWQVDARSVNRFRSIADEIVVVAVDAATHEPRTENLLRDGFTSRPTHVDPSQKAFDSLVLTGWFNLDLFAWFADLPHREARYRMFATVGEIVSNVVTVEIHAR